MTNLENRTWHEWMVERCGDSGQPTWQKRPDGRWTVTLGDHIITEAAETEAEALAAVRTHLRKNGEVSHD